MADLAPAVDAAPVAMQVPEAAAQAAEAVQAPAPPTCQICYEEFGERLELPEVKTGNGDVLRAQDCGHPICKSCMVKYITTRVEEQRVGDMPCPAVGCKARLFQKDLDRLVKDGSLPGEVRDKFVEIRSRDYAGRNREFQKTQMVDEDYNVLRCLWQNTRLCPRCNLAIEKSQGCNSFYCICGHHFCYKTAPRVVGEGVKNYDRIITFAQHLRMSCEEAEKYGGEWKLYFKAERTAEVLSIPVQEAYAMHKRAAGGDEDARAEIRRARELQRGGGEESAGSSSGSSF